MLPLEELSDYRDLLRCFYEQRKKEMPLYSYRMMGAKIGLDASYLFRILQKEQHLPQRCLPVVKELLNLQGRSGEYFDLLVASARTRSPIERRELLNKAFALRDVQRHSLDGKELEFFGQWYHAAIRALIETSGGVADARRLSACMVPPVTEEQAKESVALLKELGLVKKLASGRLGLSELHLTASGPGKVKAVRGYQKQLLGLAADSLDQSPTTERDVSTLTLSVDTECFEELRGMLKEFRRLVQKRVEECSNPDKVMQLTMAFHPLAYNSSEES